MKNIAAGCGCSLLLFGLLFLPGGPYILSLISVIALCIWILLIFSRLVKDLSKKREPATRFTQQTPEMKALPPASTSRAFVEMRASAIPQDGTDGSVYIIDETGFRMPYQTWLEDQGIQQAGKADKSPTTNDKSYREPQSPFRSQSFAPLAASDREDQSRSSVLQKRSTVREERPQVTNTSGPDRTKGNPMAKQKSSTKPKKRSAYTFDEHGMMKKVSLNTTPSKSLLHYQKPVDHSYVVCPKCQATVEATDLDFHTRTAHTARKRKTSPEPLPTLHRTPGNGKKTGSKKRNTTRKNERLKQRPPHAGLGWKQSQVERLRQSFDESRDGSKGWGHMRRESNGQFGSYPLHDDYGDEADAD